MKAYSVNFDGTDSGWIDVEAATVKKAIAKAMDQTNRLIGLYVDVGVGEIVYPQDSLKNIRFYDIETSKRHSLGFKISET